jgi:hypothetical protein
MGTGTPSGDGLPRPWTICGKLAWYRDGAPLAAYELDLPLSSHLSKWPHRHNPDGFCFSPPRQLYSFNILNPPDPVFLGVI